MTGSALLKSGSFAHRFAAISSNWALPVTWGKRAPGLCACFVSLSPHNNTTPPRRSHDLGHLSTMLYCHEVVEGCDWVTDGRVMLSLSSIGQS